MPTLDRITTSQEFVDYVRLRSDLPNLMEYWAWRYLAVGDQAYTSNGKTLEDMFDSFGNDPRRIEQDFYWWVEAHFISGKIKINFVGGLHANTTAV